MSATTHGTCAVPTCARSLVRSRSGRAAQGKSSSSTSSTWAAPTEASVPACTSAAPRGASFTSTPARFAAVRWPARALSTAPPCTCTPRTRTPPRLRAGAGEVHLVSGSERSGEERARHHRAEALDREGAIERQEERRLFRPRRGLPRPHRVGHRGHQLAQALTRPRRAPPRSSPPRGRCPAPARAIPARAARDGPARAPARDPTWSCAMTPACTPRSRSTSRCSAVWASAPSSAATQSTATSIPPAAATMARRNRSWPGTSTTPAVPMPGRSRCA